MQIWLEPNNRLLNLYREASECLFHPAPAPLRPSHFAPPGDIVESEAGDG